MASENYGFMAPIKAALDSSLAFLTKSFSRFSEVRFNAVAPSLLKTSASAGIPGYVDSYLYAEQVIPRRRAVETAEAPVSPCSCSAHVRRELPRSPSWWTPACPSTTSTRTSCEEPWPMTNLDESLSIGWHFHQRRDYLGAEAIYRRSLGRPIPNNADAWCYLGILYYDLARYTLNPSSVTKRQ
jgi:hypothetical protein